MGGGLMQLVAYGAQDIYLTGNPQITFFKVVYRRHTNFSMEAIRQTWQGTPASSGGSRAVATISRNGDLVHRLWLEATNLEYGDGTNNEGAHLINTVEVEIGGQSIDKHYGHWMEAWAELTEKNDGGAMGDGVNAGTVFQRMSRMGGSVYKGTPGGTYKNFIPLRFWFCENPGLALPLIALQYHEVKIILDTTSGAVQGADVDLWADYIYLDTDERRRFAQVSHEYLIHQVQFQSFTSGTATMVLNFNHPVKELVWTGAWNNGLLTGLSDGEAYQLKLNGHDRFAIRDRDYFTLSQVWQYHSGFGSIVSANTHAHGIAVYSFALKPEEHQPSGTCNFSRIDNAQIETGTTTPTVTNVYAVNYNVLRIMSGMGGLAYSN